MSKRSQQINASFQQGLQLQAAGRWAEAERVYRMILSAEPRHGDSLHMLGVLALQTGQPEAALPWLDRAVAASPSTTLFHANRANTLLALGRPAEAEAACRQGLRYKRNSVEAWQTLGHALSDQGRPREAVEAYREAHRHDPRLPDIHNNIGLALSDAARPEEAVAELMTAVRLAPGDDVAEGNLANVLKELGRLPEAEQAYRAILARQPDHAMAHFNLGGMLLLAGRYPEGWKEWEWRFQADPSIGWADPRPLWRGEALAGRTLLIHGEQGLGDTIQFARYLPLLPRDGRLILRVAAPLVRLLSGIDGIDRVVTLDDPVPDADLCCATMSLPLLLNLPRPEDCPTPVPYLHADPKQAAIWRERLAVLPGRKVGLTWAGNPARERVGRGRSVAVEALAGLAQVPGVSLVSLQKGAPVTGPLADHVTDWTDQLDDLADTAALTTGLDLVISIDTAVAHLAGALGRPVWLLNRFAPCWRWLLGRDDSVWYPTLRQFRQDRMNEWDTPIRLLSEALARAE